MSKLVVKGRPVCLSWNSDVIVPNGFGCCFVSAGLPLCVLTRYVKLKQSQREPRFLSFLWIAVRYSSLWLVCLGEHAASLTGAGSFL